MNAREFFDVVSQMREAQKSYFRTRSKSSLEKSKELEKQVDDEIKRVNYILFESKNLKVYWRNEEDIPRDTSR